MTVPGGDSGENPRANADQPWPDNGGQSPEQGGWPYPPGFDTPPPAPGYPQGGYPPPPPPPGGYPPPPGGYPPPPGGYPPAPGSYPPPPGGYSAPPGGYPPAGYGASADHPGFPTPPGYPPPGYGTPPGYPPAGYGSPYPGGYPDRPQKTNVLAIASLVVSLLGLLFWPLAVVGAALGVVALNQVRRTGEGGHGLAVAGTAVGAAAVVLSFILAMVTLH